MERSVPSTAPCARPTINGNGHKGMKLSRAPRESHTVHDGSVLTLWLRPREARKSKQEEEIDGEHDRALGWPGPAVGDRVARPADPVPGRANPPCILAVQGPDNPAGVPDRSRTEIPGNGMATGPPESDRENSPPSAVARR